MKNEIKSSVSFAFPGLYYSLPPACEFSVEVLTRLIFFIEWRNIQCTCTSTLTILRTMNVFLLVLHIRVRYVYNCAIYTLQYGLNIYKPSMLLERHPRSSDFGSHILNTFAQIYELFAIIF